MSEPIPDAADDYLPDFIELFYAVVFSIIGLPCLKVVYIFVVRKSTEQVELSD